MVSSRIVRLGVALVLLTACSAGNEAGGDPTTEQTRSVRTPSPTYRSIPRPSVVPTSGPSPAWTLVADGDQPLADEVVAVGAVVVLRGPELVRGVRRADGREVWRHESGDRARFRSVVPTAGGLTVVAAVDGGLLTAEVVDPATGRSRWRSVPAEHLAVYRDAVYLDDCRTDQAPCTLTSRATASGKVLWRTPSGHALSVQPSTIGARSGVAPVAGRYLAARLWSGELGRPQWAAVDTETGRLQPGRLPASDWYGVVSGDLLVATDHGQEGSTDCTVRISTVDVLGGRPRSTSVQSPTLTSGGCRRYLADTRSGQTLLGADGRFAAVEGRLPVLYDVGSGDVVWTGSDPAYPWTPIRTRSWSATPCRPAS